MPRLAVGDTAPDFTLPTADGGEIRLADVLSRGRKAVVYFYPAASTPGCTTQACDFRDNLASLQSAGYEVIGISPDSPKALARFAEKQSVTFPLAADQDRKVLQEWGAWGEKQLYGKTMTGVVRSTVVVGADGRVEHAAYNVRAKGHVTKLRRDLGLD